MNVVADWYGKTVSIMLSGMDAVLTVVLSKVALDRVAFCLVLYLIFMMKFIRHDRQYVLHIHTYNTMQNRMQVKKPMLKTVQITTNKKAMLSQGNRAMPL